MRFILLAVCLLMPTLAHATVDIYVNPKFKYSFSYPDNWMPQSENGELPHVYKVVADEGRGTGYCQITSDEDRRFMIYGPKYQADLMQREFGPEFWTGWLADYSDVKFIDIRERNGLGGGHATRVLVDYTTQTGIPQRAWMAATVSGGVKYIMECASTQEDFAGYEKLFSSIVATLRLPPAFTPFPQGFYSDFTHDKPILFPLGEGIGTTAF